MNRVFIIHGWSGNPDADWIPWVSERLKQEGCQVITPMMPDADNPITLRLNRGLIN